MRIAIASGKGGTGKTTLAANITALMARNEPVVLVDCDVEEPNSHLFFPGDWIEDAPEYVTTPEPDMDKCLGESCKKCVDLCRFKALIYMADEVMVFPELCHACGLCFEACPADAFVESRREIGHVRSKKAADAARAMHVVDGLMRVGEAMAPPLIRAVKHKADAVAARDFGEADVTRVIDCPPGASCPMIAAVNGADAAILVTEPTPFGLHDLDVAVQTLRKLNIPFGVAINRQGMGDDRVERYLENESVELFGALPHSRAAAEACSRGELLIDALPDMAPAFTAIWENARRAAQ